MTLNLKTKISSLESQDQNLDRSGEGWFHFSKIKIFTPEDKVMRIEILILGLSDPKSRPQVGWDPKKISTRGQKFVTRVGQSWSK